MKRALYALFLSSAVLAFATCDAPSTVGSVAAPDSLPPAPANVTASVGPQLNQIVVAGPTVAGATSYNVYWSTTSGVTPQNGTKITTSCCSVRWIMTHSGLTADTTYYYVVTAVNQFGEGSASAPVHATASGDIGVRMACPEFGKPTGSSFDIAAVVVSHFQIASVTARVGGDSTDLVFDPTSTLCTRSAFAYAAWVGPLSLAGLPRGPALLSITATDVFGNVAAASGDLVHDQPPTLTIVAPGDFFVARPGVRVAASCQDDDPTGCTSVAVSVAGGPLLASGSTGFDQMVSLAGYDGGSVALEFTATDSAGQVTTVSRDVFVESSTQLSEAVSVDGMIWEVQPERILFLNRANGNALTIRDRLSGGDVVIYEQAGHEPLYGYLTPLGAMFVEHTIGMNGTALHEWRAGATTDFGSSPFLAVAGNYAIFMNGGALIRRDLAAGTNTTVSLNAGTTENDVAANGDVAYWTTSYQVARFRNGVSTQLANDPLLWNTYPVTDGINVVYRKSAPCCSSVYQIAAYDSLEHVLTPADAVERKPRQDYQAANGWVAYTKSGAGSELNVWTRSPAGQERQATAFSGATSIDALGPNGEIVAINTFIPGNGAGFYKRRYVATPSYTTAPRDISSGLGSAFFQNGTLFVIIGRSLFQVSP